MNKTLMLIASLLFSLNALATPINLESINFLYSEYSDTTHIASSYSSSPTSVQKHRYFESLAGGLAINSGTNLNSSYLGYDFNQLGMMWFDSNLNLYAVDFSSPSSGPVKLVDGSVFTDIEAQNTANGAQINGIFSYGSFLGTYNNSTNSFEDIGSPYYDPNIGVGSYIYDNALDINDYFIECSTLDSCDNGNVVGMQYFDSKDDTYYNGDLYYLIQKSTGEIKDNAFYKYNIGTNDREIAFTFEDLGITNDIAPTRGFTFFNNSDYNLIEDQEVSVSEPSTLGLLTIGTVALAGARKGAVKAICKKSGFCLLIDTIKKTLIGTAKVAK